MGIKKEEYQKLNKKIKTLEEDIQTVQDRVNELKELARNHIINPKQMQELRKKKKVLHEWKCELNRLKMNLEKLDK